MTAEDVKYTYDLAISANCTYNPSVCLDGFLESAEVVDDRTIAFTLVQPYSPFLTTILPTIGVESRAVIESAYEEFTGAAASLDPADVRAASDAIAGPAGEDEPDVAGCEAALADAEGILTQAGLELPRREESPARWTQHRQHACARCWTTPDVCANSSASSRPQPCDTSRTIPRNRIPDRPVRARS